MLVVIAEKTRSGPEQWEAFVEGYEHSPRAAAENVTNAVVKLLWGLGIFDASGARYEHNDSQTRWRLVFDSHEVVSCPNCQGRGTEVLFQLPQDCQACNGVGFLLPDGSPTNRGYIDPRRPRRRGRRRMP